MKKNKIIGAIIAVVAVAFIIVQFDVLGLRKSYGGNTTPIEDKRVQVTDQSDEKYQSTVLINSVKKQNEFGTGYVVGTDTVVTNKHVVMDVKNDLESFVVKVGHKDKDGKVEFKEFKVKELVLPKDDALDVAVLKLEKDADGKSISEYRKIAEFGDSSKVTKGTVLSVVGYPGDKDYATMWDSTGEVEEVMGDMISFKAVTAPGNSGSPMFNSEGKVVAMNNAGGDNNSFGFLITEDILKFFNENMK